MIGPVGRREARSVHADVELVPRTWLRTAAPLVAVSAALVATGLVVLLVAYRLQVADPLSPPLAALQWFDVSSERNVPTAWSTLLLLGSAVTATLLWLRGRRTDVASAGWLLVAATTSFLALDESLELHERLGSVGSAVVDDRLHFAWVVPGAALTCAVGLLLLHRLRSQPLEVRRRLVVAGAVYLSGALALETLSGAVLRAYGGGGRAYAVVTSAEEGLEMTGASLLLAALLCAHAGLRSSRAAAAGAPLVPSPRAPARRSSRVAPGG